MGHTSFGQAGISRYYICLYETCQNKQKFSRNSWILNSLNTFAVALKIGILLKEEEAINAFLKETG